MEFDLQTEVPVKSMSKNVIEMICDKTAKAKVNKLTPIMDGRRLVVLQVLANEHKKNMFDTHVMCVMAKIIGEMSTEIEITDAIIDNYDNVSLFYAKVHTVSNDVVYTANNYMDDIATYDDMDIAHNGPAIDAWIKDYDIHDDYDEVCITDSDCDYCDEVCCAGGDYDDYDKV